MTARLSLVAVGVVSALLLGGCGTPDSPKAAAIAWADASVHHDDVSTLQCASGAGTSTNLLGLTDPSISGVKATGVQKTGTSWKVDLETKPSGTGFSVNVVRRGGKYLVCGQ